MTGRFYVGEWLVEPNQNRLVQGSESTRLDAKAVAVLSFLAQHPNDVVTKEQIISAVWEGAFVSDEVLTTAIWSLRKTLGDDAKEPRYIKTIPRQGYRHRKGRVGCSFSGPAIGSRSVVSLAGRRSPSGEKDSNRRHAGGTR